MKQDKQALLRDELANLEKAAAYLAFSLDRSRGLIGRESWSPQELERLESLTSRYSRLCDLLTQRVLRLIDDLELTPEGTLLDRFHRAEKRGWVANAGELVRLRELRNLIAHEYAADQMAEVYRVTGKLAPELLALVPAIMSYAQDLLRRYSAASS